MLDAHPDIHMRGEGSNANPCNENENETARLREVTRFLNKPGRYRVRGHKLGTMFFNDPASLEVRRMWVRGYTVFVVLLLSQTHTCSVVKRQTTKLAARLPAAAWYSRSNRL